MRSSGGTRTDTGTGYFLGKKANASGLRISKVTGEDRYDAGRDMRGRINALINEPLHSPPCDGANDGE